jgi:hypothetical protein
MGFYLGDKVAREYKQHLSLSRFAWSIIKQDMMNFSEYFEKPNYSGFINQIIRNFYDSSIVSINQISLKAQEKFLLNISSIQDNEIRKNYRNFIELMIKFQTIDYLSTFSKIEKTQGMKFRINKFNKEMLESLDVSNYFNNNLGLYLRAMFEDYASKTISQREAIYFADTFSIIKEGISIKKLISLQLKNGQRLYLKPYELISDNLSYFNYVIGTNQDESSIISFRLSKIENVKINYSLSGKITKKSVFEIKSLLEKKGCQFLVSNLVQATIKLTDKGIEKYKQQIHLRPVYVTVKKNLFTFSCTESQLWYYFLKFGQDCEVITPLELRRKFEKTFRKSLELYEN